MDPWNTLGTVPKSLFSKMALLPNVELFEKFQGKKILFE